MVTKSRDFCLEKRRVFDENFKLFFRAKSRELGWESENEQKKEP